MKFLPIILFAALVSCNTPATVQVGDITVKSSGRAGGKGMIYVSQGDTQIRIADDNEDSFREINKTGRFGLGAAQLGSVARSGINAAASVKNAKTAAGVTNTAAKEGTKQAAIAAEREAARLAAEEAAAAAAPQTDLVLPPIPQT